MNESGVTHPTVTPIEAADEARSVRQAREEDRADLAAAFADGFFDDPVMSWAFEDDTRRREQLRRAFAIFHRRFWAASDLTYTTGQISSVCVWLLPGAWHSSVISQLVAMPQMLRAFGPRGLVRLLRLLSVMESNHPHDDHYYLPVISVARAWQGKGLGSALVGPMLSRCDSEQMPAYLEATSERSRDLYLRHGFEVREELSCPDDGPSFWPMWREPAVSRDQQEALKAVGLSA